LRQSSYRNRDKLLCWKSALTKLSQIQKMLEVAIEQESGAETANEHILRTGETEHRDGHMIDNDYQDDAVLQRLAFQKLHGDEGLAILLVDVVTGADVGMVQRRGRLRFAGGNGPRR